ncbi:aminotransferase class V-fold PLP-dependent enzyme [Candidatus Saccharibacteria bacterium oral taxon 488]|nr:aminotransferase class V-fold PLP-dependent enzyme [Candidatus Saccharibacteria bacterium oral taxon 488]
MIYLDHAAATPMDPLVVEAMQPYFSEKFFNPSSPYAPAVTVKRDYREAKSRIARVLGVGADELVMTAGATESINLAFTAAGGVSLISAIEHSSVINSAKARSEVRFIPPTNNGRIDPQTVKTLLTPDVSFMSIALANHELGYIQPIEEIAEVVRLERVRRQEHGESTPLMFHTDASQTTALMDVKIKRLGVDLLTLSAAKVYGPKQVGLLWLRPGVKLRPTIVGGGQEAGLRSGTENVAGVVGFATALELAAKRRSGEVKRLRGLRDVLAKKLLAAFPDMIISSDQKKSLVNFLNISFPGVDAERLMFLLEARGVLVATGSACAANSGTRSHVLAAIGLSDAAIDGSLRLTLGRLNDEAQVMRAADEIITAVRTEQERTQ